MGASMVLRPPTNGEIVLRGASSSVALLGAWLVGSFAIRAIIQRRPRSHSVSSDLQEELSCRYHADGRFGLQIQ